ncbi:cyclic nucleotide-binding domain protein (macronuclear) [Tetrahymena thermophila SB210]|uniref:Cyclic nucleotide-binding domain protein n=1 Tax=Tetrahymena thermophila (strain SB210) TaxID=312017 RepID=W7X9N3_TETTS|nr:cyclic nucleotide-binding domain protein [Tetrahymena thermophila SB210]EWS76115.1 cyclic nucleotide-binding domain protein [Tetrahymena thermophila SB210]|eukprot:XP_012651355.1 cyclic nucleotide-binding domain protein [Tetrahymena thermophila SB210]
MFIQPPSIELELFSPELKNKDGQRKLKKHKSFMSKQITIIDNTQITNQSNNQSSYMEEKQSVRKIAMDKGSELKLKDIQRQSSLDVQKELVIQQNTQNLINYIKLMQESKLINPIIENRNNNMADINKKKKTFINQNGTVFNNSDIEIKSLNVKDEKAYQGNNFPQGRKQKSITSLIKKSDRQIFIKGKTTIPSEKSYFFPIRENIFVRNTNDLDINLLIYRKQLLWSSDILKQVQGQP